jgi:iron-sulfur cluster assembly accessory protein
MSDELIVSEAAFSKVQELIEDEDNEYLMLRVFVTGGGCAGFQYGFTFDEEIAEDDTVVQKDNVKVLVDSLSIQYVGGSTVNYSEGLEGAKFSIENPQAESTCGCGSSFSM